MFYLINKQKGVSSFFAIKKWAREHNVKKIGHTGTLDPLATGLLLIATDDDTKLIDFVDKGYKTYEATMVLGEERDTFDITGEVINSSPLLPTMEEIVDAITSFVGVYKQTPPAFSAKRINGERAYDLARQGKDVNLNSVEVEIKQISNIVFHTERVISFSVEVSRGTYIRSLIHDIGNKLKTYAYMSELKRTTIGSLTLDQVDQEVDIKDLLIIPIYKTEDIKPFWYGLPVKTEKQNGFYALEYQSVIVGTVKVENGTMVTNKLFGNKIKNI